MLRCCVFQDRVRTRRKDQQGGHMHYDTIVLLGPTASGKTRLGVALARS